MNPNSITRQQRRELQRLAEKVGEATEGDRRFFERFPGRRHRMRRMSAAEIASAAATSRLNPIPTGQARYSLVKQIAPGWRLRIFIFGPADQSGDEAGETVAAALYDEHAAHHPEVRRRERALIEAAQRAGDAS